MKGVWITLAIILIGTFLSAQTPFEQKQPDFQEVLDEIVDNKKIFGSSFCVKYKGQTWCGNAGNIGEEQQYFIASATKLFTTTIILKFISEGKLSLDDTIDKYIDEVTLQDLHVYKGVDYSKQITICNLLAHTSGLADYFQNSDAENESLEDKLFSGNDQFWSFDQAVEKTKGLQPLFAPGTIGKAHYSDTNFQLLGKIIENISQKTFSQNCQEHITKPLNLKKTYLYSDTSDLRPQPLHYKQSTLVIPKAMTSFGADGGIVSNSQEMLIFIEAFFNGRLFPKSYIDDIQVWNSMFYPIQSGIGIHRFKLPSILGIPEMIGHSGLSGALAYYNPKSDIYVAGTVNQIAYPSTSFGVATKLIQTVKRKMQWVKTTSAIGVGTTYSNILNNGGKPKIGLSLGLYKEYKFFKHVSLTTEIMYNQRGERSKNEEEDIRLHYLDLPVMVKFNLFDNKLGLSAGVSTNILLGSSMAKNTIKRLEYSIPISMKYAIADYLHLDVRYNIGMNDIAKNTYATKELKNRWLSVSLLLVGQ